MSAAIRGLKVIQGSVADASSVKDTGWLDFISAASFGFQGLGILWSNYVNCLVNDGLIAQCLMFDAGDYSSELLGENLSATGIPDTAIIRGIAVRVEKRQAVADATDFAVRLQKDGSIAGENKAIAGTWPISYYYTEYGAFNDTWGLSLTGADVNAANFGFSIKAFTELGGVVLQVDHMQMRIYYEEQ